jgi:hypothetical protein
MNINCHKNHYHYVPAAAALCLMFAFASCAASGLKGKAPSGGSPKGAAPGYPSVTFCVLSDTHMYDTSLGTSGAAWDAYMAEDRKLLKESEETLRTALADIKAVHPSFVLVTGDLTKDGELQNHRLFARYLADLAAEGIKSYVLPGNHDINNPASVCFLPDGRTEPVPNVDPAAFVSIYLADGYGSALSRDPASLSYVAEVAPNLWLLALDSAKYEHNSGRKWSETSGAIRPETYTWIESVLKDASSKGIAVIAAEHHPLMEHIRSMKNKYPEYIVDDNWKLASLLAAYNVRLFFTGHYHASSIVEHSWPSDAPQYLAGKTIVDIETGSLVTWPCSWRTVTLANDGSASITTNRVAQIPSYEAAGRNFDTEGRAVIANGIGNIAEDTMKGYHVPKKDIDRLVPDIVDAMMAHYKGDADLGQREMFPPKNSLSLTGKIVVKFYTHFISGLWKKEEPEDVHLMEDNNLVIHSDGTWTAR